LTLKPRLGVTQDYRKLYHSIQHLLTFHSNHWLISHSFRDGRRFPLKIAQKLPIFPTPYVFNAPAEGVPLAIGYRRRGQKKLEWWGYQMVEKVLR